MQFSDFDDCTVKMCKILKDAGDKGFGHLEIGKLLENDGIERKDGAYIKYGENHSKTATQLGLLNQMSNRYFLSCLGYIFNDLSDENKEKLICRLILRNKHVRRLVYKCYFNEKVSYCDETGFLSQKTMLRRKSNVKKVINILKENKEYDLKEILSKIDF